MLRRSQQCTAASDISGGVLKVYEMEVRSKRRQDIVKRQVELANSGDFQLFAILCVVGTPVDLVVVQVFQKGGG